MKKFLALFIILALASCAPAIAERPAIVTANSVQGPPPPTELATPETSIPALPTEEIRATVEQPAISGPFRSDDSDVTTYILSDLSRHVICYIVTSTYASNLDCVEIRR